MGLNEIEEIQTSEDSEAEILITANKSSSYLEKSTPNNKKKVKPSSKSKRHSTFNKIWLKDPKFSSFLRECRTDSHFAHCCLCNSDFSISNGGVYLVIRHAEQASHKRLAEIEVKKKCNV